MSLSGSEKKQLRGQAQVLKPALLVGKNGLTGTVLHEVNMAFEKHPLIKIRFNTDRDQLATLSQEIAEKTASTLLGSVGKTASFYRELPSEAE